MTAPALPDHVSPAAASIQRKVAANLGIFETSEPFSLKVDLAGLMSEGSNQ